MHEYELKNYEELKSAIESKKLHKDIEGMTFNRWAALISAFTALLSVSVLIWQSGATQVLGQKKVLELRIENLNDDIDKLELKKEHNDSLLKSNESEIIAKRAAIAKLKVAIENKNTDLNNIQTSISEKTATKDKLELKINNLKSQLSEISAGSRDEELANSKAKVIELDSQVDDLKAKLKNLQSKSEIQESSEENLKNQLSEEKQKNTQLMEKNEKYLEMSSSLLALQKKTGLSETSVARLSLERNKNGVVGDYTITLTNVGNIQENIDININKSEGRGSSNYVDLRKNVNYVLRYEEALFFVYVIEANQAPQAEEESAVFEVLVFQKPYRIVY